MKITQRERRFVTEYEAQTHELLKTLARIPAPSGQEEKRAAFCKDWLVSQGAVETYIDSAGNVICPVGDVQNGELAVIAAHSDIVFPDTDALPLSARDGRLYAPGVGDDTANVAVLLMAAKHITEQGLRPQNGGVLFVVDTCEEGLGNLKGIRQLMQDFGSRVTEFISFDCHADEVIDTAVGSKRFCLTATTEGGHSYFDFGGENAIVALCRFATAHYDIPVPQNSGISYNVGEIKGGTSVNTIAQEAQLLFEYRSKTASGLAYMDEQVAKLLERCQKDGLSLTMTALGDRPCGETVDDEAKKRLVDRVSAAIETHFGFVPTRKAGSTDCNIPLSMGIPSVCFGCVLGGGMHTREEYIETDSIRAGLLTALDTILYYF